MNSHKVTLFGKMVKLTAIEQEEVSLVAKWLNDEDVVQYIAQYLPVSVQNVANWISPPRNDNLANIILGIRKVDDSELIGFTSLTRINWKDRNAESFTVIGEQSNRAKGYGTESKKILLDFAFKSLNLHKVKTRVVAYNEPSKRHLLNAGYVVEGVLKDEIFKDGQYWDLICMSCISD